MSSWTFSKSRVTAAAMMCAALWRITFKSKSVTPFGYV
jgi:hypothetical protein